jgi:diacylglycerol kinase family enzyme
MRAVVLINEKAGTVVERGAGILAETVRAAFAEAGHAVEVDCCAPDRMDDAIGQAAARTDIDVVVAGGGDGTLSAAAATLAGSKIALGCLPLGTMNLYCRALGMPMDIDDAIRSLAAGRIAPADMGDVNGRLFLHHVSIGLQPSIVMTRNREDYSGRLGKMWATAKTFVRKLRNPAPVSVEVDLPGGARRFRVPAIFVTSNPLLEGQPGVEQSRDAHRLGLYICTSARWDDLLQVGASMMLSDGERAESLEFHELSDVTIRRSREGKGGFLASVDGEIVRFDSPLEIACREGAVRLLLPEPAARP